ncbi:MAG: DUF1501 domain-containing protein, partial [Planctomycetia bacterium]|nr:DUF1501 domain-containing protein [Planctomycetia bacterium]
MNPALPDRHFPEATSRRGFLRHAGGGFGALALAWLMEQDARAEGKGAANPLATRAPHFPGKAQRVIFLFMHGGPSHLE